MKSTRITLLLLAGLALSAVSQAQIITRTFNITNTEENTGVVTQFVFSVNLGTDAVTVVVDNTVAGVNQVKGTVVGFAFNTPWATPSQLDVNDVAFSGVWNIGTGSAANWSEFAPFEEIDPSKYWQDYGVFADQVNQGVSYGEKATFTFAFNRDINAGNVGGFFDNQFDFSARWQQVGTNQAFSEKGYVGFNGPSDSELPPAPEPSTYGLMGAAALLGLVAHRRRKAKIAAKAV